jgi:serine/threonine-protein kinase Chk2
MLVVEPERRFTIDQCISHPWLNGTAPQKYDSTTSIVGSIASLEINRRGHTRERTLLSSLNNVQVVAEVPINKDKKTAKVFSKN